ncbi:MAG: AsmA family protein [Xanthobacteraceae bacterium]
MQTTLLGLAIATILALLTALVGPLFVDWGAYRAEFEKHAGRLTGFDVRISGEIDARLLPTPTLVLHQVELGRGSEKIAARALRVEFSLQAVMRGEWRITDAQLESPQVAAGIDLSGQMVWPVPKVGFDPGAISIERLIVRDGRATLTDAATGAHLVLDKLEFTGELRSLAGPIKGAGSFVWQGRQLPYRVATGRIAENSPVRVRLTFDPTDAVDQRLSAEVDLAVSIENGAPHFEGNLQVARAVGRAEPGASGLISESWRASAQLSGDSGSALLEQIEFQYGSEERATKLRGTAKLNFGQRPEIIGQLASTQINLDWLVGSPDAMAGRPAAAVKALAEAIFAAPRVPLPMDLALVADSVTLGGATLQRLSMEIGTSGDKLQIKSLDVRAPGLTQVSVQGQIASAAAGLEFSGSTSIEAADPGALLTWLANGRDLQIPTPGPLRVSGAVTLGSEAAKIENLSFELDKLLLTGGLAYRSAGEGQASRVDADLATPDIDLDRLQTLAKAILSDTSFDRPREGSLSLKIGRAVVAGVEAKQLDVRMRVDGKAVQIERLSVADFGGASFRVENGRIAANPETPDGSLVLNVEARALDGLVMILEKVAPTAAERVRRIMPQATPLRLRAELDLRSVPSSSDATARIKLNGDFGRFKVAAEARVQGPADTFDVENLGALASAKFNAAGRLDAEDGTALVEVLALDPLLAVEKRAGRLAWSAKGALNGDVSVDAQLVVGTFNLATVGTVRMTDAEKGNEGPSAKLDVRVDKANLRSPRRALPGRGELLPTSVTTSLTLQRGTLQLSELKGSVAGSPVRGWIAVGLQQQPLRLNGELELGSVDLPGVIAAAVGIPSGGAPLTNGGPASGPWPTEPFETVLPPLMGEIQVKSPRLFLTPKLVARDVKTRLRFEDSAIALQEFEGSLAGGQIGGELRFWRRDEALTARARVSLRGVNAAELLPGEGAVTGQLTATLAVEGSGMSAVALIGSLAGDGQFAVENARLARLDPGAFNAVMRAVDQGLPVDLERVRDRIGRALAGGGLPVPHVEGTIAVDAGQARLARTTLSSAAADLEVMGSVNVADLSLDARLTLLGAAGQGALANTRPEVTIGLKGQVDAPKRTIDVAALTTWLALRAVEQQAQKLEQLEGREPSSSISPSLAPAAAMPPSSSAGPLGRESPPINGLSSASAVPGPIAPRPVPAAAPASSTPASTEPESTRSPAPPARARAPTADQVQPLDIRPSSAPRSPRPASTSASTTSATAAGQPQAKQAAPPARPRSLYDMLFGN